MKTLLLASALILGLFGSSAAVPPPAPLPYHPFCRVLWLFETTCAEISITIAKQIQSLSPEYELVSATALKISANHTSPDGINAQNITFSFSATTLTSGCRVSAQSTSLAFSSLLDDGLNYCVLYKLLSESGLSSAPGFMEMTNEWACLGYGMAKCRV